MATRNTSFYHITAGDLTVIYRDLDVLELSYLSNIKKDVFKYEMAAKAAIVDPQDPSSVPWPILQQIGQSVIERSLRWIGQQELFEILVKEYRNEINSKISPLNLIKEILQVFPGQSVTDLLRLTWKDLIELTCLAEAVSGKKILNVAGAPGGRRGGVNLANSQTFEDDGSSLQEKMDALNASLGGIPR